MSKVWQKGGALSEGLWAPGSWVRLCPLLLPPLPTVPLALFAKLLSSPRASVSPFPSLTPPAPGPLSELTSALIQGEFQTWDRGSLVLTSGSSAQSAPRGPSPTPSALLSSLAPSPGGPDVLEPQRDTETQSRPSWAVSTSFFCLPERRGAWCPNSALAASQGKSQERRQGRAQRSRAVERGWPADGRALGSAGLRDSQVGPAQRQGAEKRGVQELTLSDPKETRQN